MLAHHRWPSFPVFLPFLSFPRPEHLQATHLHKIYCRPTRNVAQFRAWSYIHKEIQPPPAPPSRLRFIPRTSRQRIPTTLWHCCHFPDDSRVAMTLWSLQLWNVPLPTLTRPITETLSCLPICKGNVKFPLPYAIQAIKGRLLSRRYGRHRKNGECGVGSQSLERKSRGQSRQEESYEWRHSSPKGVVLLTKCRPTAPLIPNLGTTCRWVLTSRSGCFTPGTQ